MTQVEAQNTDDATPPPFTYAFSRQTAVSAGSYDGNLITATDESMQLYEGTELMDKEEVASYMNSIIANSFNDMSYQQISEVAKQYQSANPTDYLKDLRPDDSDQVVEAVMERYNRIAVEQYKSKGMSPKDARKQAEEDAKYLMPLPDGIPGIKGETSYLTQPDGTPIVVDKRVFKEVAAYQIPTFMASLGGYCQNAIDYDPSLANKKVNFDLKYTDTWQQAADINSRHKDVAFTPSGGQQAWDAIKGILAVPSLANTGTVEKIFQDYTDTSLDWKNPPKKFTETPGSLGDLGPLPGTKFTAQPSIQADLLGPTQKIIGGAKNLSPSKDRSDGGADSPKSKNAENVKEASPEQDKQGKKDPAPEQDKHDKKDPKQDKGRHNPEKKDKPIASENGGYERASYRGDAENLGSEGETILQASYKVSTSGAVQTSVGQAQGTFEASAHGRVTGVSQSSTVGQGGRAQVSYVSSSGATAQTSVSPKNVSGDTGLISKDTLAASVSQRKQEIYADSAANQNARSQNISHNQQRVQRT